MNIIYRDYFRKYHYTDPDEAETYDDRKFGSAAQSRYNRATQKALNQALYLLPDGSRILDVPCGTGRWTEMVVRKRMEYVGGDISQEMMKICQRKHRTIQKTFDLVQLDGIALPFPDKTFNAILTFKFLSLLPEDIRLEILREFRRVTKQYLIAQSQHFRTFCPWRTVKLFASRCLGISWRVKKYETRTRLLPLIESAGFKVTARLLIRCSILDYLWPFNLEYLVVLEPTQDP